MSRTVLTTAVGVLLLSLAACSGDSPTGGPASSTGAGPVTTATATATEPAVEADYSANTKKICDQVDRRLEGAELERFAQRLGQLIVYKQAGQTAKATQAQAAAQRELRNLATAVRRDTASAQDPGLKAAGEEAAAGIEESAADKVFFAKLKTIKDVDKRLQVEMTPWLTPLATYCA